MMAIPPKLYLTIGNDQYIELDGLQDAVSLSYQDNNATVTATLYDLNDAIAVNADGSAALSGIEMSYIAGSQGSYRGLVDSTFNPPLGGGYTLNIVATVPGGADPSGNTQGEWFIPIQVIERIS